MQKTKVEKHFDNVSESYDKGKDKYKLYYSTLKNVLKKIIPPKRHVLEVGCGTGTLLASLCPSKGYGMDISQNMIKIAKKKYANYQNLNFSTTWPTKHFDFIFMSDVVEHLEDPKLVFSKICSLMDSKSLFINTMANPIWEPILMVWEKLGLKMVEGQHKRISFREIEGILNKVGLKVVKHDYKLLVPVNIPFITAFLNKYLEKYFKKLAFIEYFVAVKA